MAASPPKTKNISVTTSRYDAKRYVGGTNCGDACRYGRERETRGGLQIDEERSYEQQQW